jgi:cobalamin biosynthesis Mg chelatase CobN
MTEGRKSRWGTRALFCALAALAITAVAPAVAGASPAEDEYDLNLPEADGQSNDPTQQSAGDSSAPTGPTEASPSASRETDDEQGSAAAAGSGGNDDGQGGGGTGGGDKATETGEQPFASSADEQTVSDLAADRSDGAGVSMPLILLAVAAAACAGIAFWRLRRSKDDSDEQTHEPGARPGDVARGTQSS